MSIVLRDALPRDDSDDSDSANEPDPAAADTSTALDGRPPKRRGGRKPMYATTEERKQRNRQAQAAFRERRTEYIRQLEELIKLNEANHRTLQASHRNAADECLMLRYKNSLLERILMEKGVDVQAELCAKAFDPVQISAQFPSGLVSPLQLPALPPQLAQLAHPPILPPGQSSMQPMLALQQQSMPHSHRMRRSISTMAPSLDSGGGSESSSLNMASTSSSYLNSTVHSLVPATMNLPTYQHPAMLSPIPAPLVDRTLQRPPGMIPILSQSQSALSAAPGIGPGFYTVPGFSTPIDQLASRYDIMEDVQLETSTAIAVAPYSTPDSPHPDGGPMQPQHQSTMSPAPTHHRRRSTEQHQQQQRPRHRQILPYPHMLSTRTEWDPFGLSASMVFPGPSSSDQNNTR